jgi:hypothetical protein
VILDPTNTEDDPYQEQDISIKVLIIMQEN